LIDRHPDVFKDKTAHNNQYHNQWERIKYAEKRQKSRLYQGDSCSFGLLSDIAQNLPALSMAGKLQKRAACVGFDWRFSKEVFDQLVSEVREVEKAMAENDASDVLEEIGDVMFCCVSLIRHYEADPEKIMRQANNKFKRRFEAMEREADKRQQSLADMDKDTLENLWALAKK
jgi:ATP diphosphatase